MMPHVQELVTMFENIYRELQIESVWFIKKSRRGDGFQRWHQDLVGIGTTVATIVINIDSVDKKDEEFEVENICCLKKEVIDVFQQGPDDAEESINKDKGGQQKTNEVEHVRSSFRFSTANKAPHPDLVSEYACQANEHINNIAHSKSVTATEVVDIDDRKHLPESVNKVLENFVTASNAVDIDDRKRPPEIVNKVPENSAIATEAVDIDDSKHPQEIVPLLAQAKANIQNYEWNTHIIAANNKTPPSKVPHPSNMSQSEYPDLAFVPSLPPMMQPPSSAITVNDGGDSLGGISYSLLTGAKSFIDDTVTDGDSLQTKDMTTWEQYDNELIEILDLEDSNMRGDGGDSDAEGDGYDIAQSFVDGMVEVEHERYNADGFQIEREVECDDQTAVEGEGAMVISDDNSAPL